MGAGSGRPPFYFGKRGPRDNIRAKFGLTLFPLNFVPYA